jgi:site-specific recombinase XerD
MGLERVFEAPHTLLRLRREPLGALLEGFCEWLLDHGYSRQVVRKHLGNAAYLNAWLAEKGWRWSGKLSRKQVDRFFKAYPYRCHNRGSLANHLRVVRYSIHRFVSFLTDRGVFDPRIAVPVYQPLLSAYLVWMREHQYASEGTLDLRGHSVGKFLESLGAKGTPEGLPEVTAEHIETFLIDYARGAGRAARRSMQSGLRTFFRFCFCHGYIRHRLDHAVPTLRTYRLARVPRGLGERQAQAVLRSVDRHTPSGRRDYAILQLLYSYGVRGGQVRALRMDDIRWAEDQILFRAIKNGKDVLWPLTAEVGGSLFDYIQKARPPCSFPEVFLTCRAPYRPLPASSSLSEIVRRRIVASDLDPYSKGAHAFRHTFASRMVARGVPFKAVADALGHRHLSTTFIYTKVDFNALRQVALEWPGEVRS